MLATLVDKPFNDEDWLFEIKLDGFRAIAELDKSTIKLYSRNLLSFNQRFPILIQQLKDLSLDAILDGEIVVLNKKGISEFQKLQNFRSDSDIYYYVFDILYWEGQDLRKHPLTERKAILEKILGKGSQIRYLDHVENRGLDFFKFCQDQGLEGMVAKQKESPYMEGIRSKSWLKIKNEHSQEAVICGFTEPLGGRKGFGALVVGFYKKGKIHFSGHVGGGFTVKKINEIKALLSPLIVSNCPFESVPKTNTKVTWVTPKYICEVKFKELTSEGIMRQPIFQGLRMDKSPEEVVEEKPKSTKLVHDKAKPSKSTKEKKERLVGAKKGKNLDLIEEFPFLTHLDKLYWEKEKITKGEVLRYYVAVADVMLPYLVDRPQILKRFPNGVSQASFYQKNLENHPNWISTITIKHENRSIDYLLIEDVKSLLYAVNLGCIEIHSWFSSVQHLNNPDFLILDLDPEDISFEAVIETALLLHEILEKFKIPHFCKTSGSRGLHIAVPLGAKYSFEQAKHFALLIATLAHDQMPKIISLERNPKNRQKKVYIDCLQNNFGQTLAMPYSLRAKAGAPVSTPLEWGEVKSGLTPLDFTIFNTHERLVERSDPFRKIFQKGIDLKQILKLIDHQ